MVPRETFQSRPKWSPTAQPPTGPGVKTIVHLAAKQVKGKKEAAILNEWLRLLPG
jgi:hypothetical protein